MSEYIYTPLNVDIGEIRLVELHPGHFDDPLVVSISVSPFTAHRPEQNPPGRLDQIIEGLPEDWTAYETPEGRILYHGRSQETQWTNPTEGYDESNDQIPEPLSSAMGLQYEALSYAWGSPSAEKSVQVVPSLNCKNQTGGFAGNDETTTILVHKNLFDALKHLRGVDEPRTLWIDAISINQKDKVERSQQVSLMDDIFKCAARVIVWLGLPSYNSRKALRNLAYIGDQVEITVHDRLIASPDCAEPHFWKCYDARDMVSSEGTWQSVLDLISRPWFSRLWVVQEIQLASESALIQCGFDTILWRQLRRALYVCRSLRFPENLSPLFNDQLRTGFDLATCVARRTPVTLLRMVKYFECSDPRDKIYGILGLLPPNLSKEIRPDYTQPFKEVYRKAFIAYVEWTRQLDILSIAGPSWIPDWRSNSRTMELSTLPCHTASEVSFTDNNVMNTLGSSFDKIVAVTGPIYTADQFLSAMKQTMWWGETLETQTYPTGEAVSIAFASTVTEGFSTDRLPHDLHVKYSLAEMASALESFEKDRNRAQKSMAHLRIGKLARSRYIFRTEKGYFGICRMQVQVDDKVANILGCPCPVVLRSEADSKYLFLGCTTIHGLMDDEGILGPIPAGYHVIIYNNTYNDPVRVFIDNATKQYLPEDPRLGPLPSDWNKIITNDPRIPLKKVNAFISKVTGQILYTDPRLLPDALRARGVCLETFSMI